ncbi:MAG TPA: hypothetical protein VE173_05880, partial [Longimicrobiales bacterium]|nr:hypothetical protein [Longimicrobiales bacterium]
MNLEINIKVPLGSPEVSITRPLSEADLAAEPQPPPPPVPEDFLPPSRVLPFEETGTGEGRITTSFSAQGNGSGETVAEVEAPPSLEELGIELEPPGFMEPPSLEALGMMGGAAEATPVPPGLEGME